MFARELSYFIVTMYVPCFIIVIVSWFAFWIDHKSVGACIIVTSHVSRVTCPGPGPRDAGCEHAAGTLHHPGQHSEVPPPGGLHEGGAVNQLIHVPHATAQAIDVWTGVCVFFVFLTLLEYALVNYAAR